MAEFNHSHGNNFVPRPSSGLPPIELQSEAIGTSGRHEQSAPKLVTVQEYNAATLKLKSHWPTTQVEVIATFKLLLSLYIRCEEDELAKHGNNDPLAKAKKLTTFADQALRTQTAVEKLIPCVFQHQANKILLAFAQDSIRKIKSSNVKLNDAYSSTPIDQALVAASIALMRATKALPNELQRHSAAQGGVSVVKLKADVKGPKLKDRSADWAAKRLEETERRKAALRQGLPLNQTAPKQQSEDELQAQEIRQGLVQGHEELLDTSKPTDEQREAYQQRPIKLLRTTIPGDNSKLSDAELDEERAKLVKQIADLLKSWMENEVSITRVQNGELDISKIPLISNVSQLRYNELRAASEMPITIGTELKVLLQRLGSQILTAQSGIVNQLTMEERSWLKKLTEPDQEKTIYELA